MKVLFVGDRPSRLNFSADVAFVGTPSFINLCKWIEKMQVVEYTMVNSHTHADEVEICRFYNTGKYKFVALGNNASKALTQLDINHFKLPHPSPRNRKLNDHNYIVSQLEKCYSYLMERQCVSYVKT